MSSCTFSARCNSSKRSFLAAATSPRVVSVRGLDIEQIGHVYEGLLDHTARRAGQVILGLAASKGRIVTVALERLETLAAKSPEKLIEFLVEETERTESTLRNVLFAGGEKPRRGRKASTQLDLLAGATPAAAPPPPVSHAILAACDHDQALAARVAPYAALLRPDTFARPLVILPDSLYVAPGSDRRSTGTHYTPRSLTEPIVQHTLEPLVYHGPSEGLPRGDWRLKTPREILALKVCDLAMGSGAFLVGVCRYLSARLVEAWTEVERTHPDAFITSPEGDLSTGDPSEALIARRPDDERLHLAARAIADRCLYGVDINPMAVEMAKLSLWLITVDRERPFTFLDHALKCGDSLLGISDTRQLERFSLREGDAAQPLLETANLWRHVQQGAQLRRELEATPSHTAAQLVEKTRLHGDAEALLARLRAAADFLFAAELDSPGDRGWDTRRAIAASHMQAAWKKDTTEFQRLARAELRGRRTFHWPLEFPEVFDAGENGERPGGFDAFVGNPPFMGGKKITGELGTDYRDYLVSHVAAAKNGVADICTYFFLRVHQLLRRPKGIAGLVATNTIAQGDTREVGLDQITASGGDIPRAFPSQPWPGDAALEVAYVWLSATKWLGEFALGERVVSSISPYLAEPGRATGKPLQLAANAGKSHIGSYVLGSGFLLSEREARQLLERDPANQEAIFPYLIGEDINSTPTQLPSRWIINFADWPLDRSADGCWRTASDEQRTRWLRVGRVPADYRDRVAADLPSCIEIVRREVKPERDKNNRDSYRERWWRFAERQANAYRSTRGFNKVLVRARTSRTHAPVFVSNGVVFSEGVVVFAMASFAEFSVVQSSLHEAWAWDNSSTLKADLRYSPTDCFETFSFPTGLNGLEAVGERYHEHRRQLMQARDEGLTKTYNRFHDPEEMTSDIAELRTLHRQLDIAVAAAYGWPDLAAHEGSALGHDFHETKQGIRFTLAPEVRREVLDRLLTLNHQRHAEEVAAGLHEKKTGKQKAKHAKRPLGAAPLQGELIPPAQGDLFDAPAPIAPSAPRILPAVDAYVPPAAPAGKRVAAPPEDFAVNLLRGILVAGGGSLSFDGLRDAFVLATRPDLMRETALSEDATLVSVWSQRREASNETVEPRNLLPALRRLGSNNLLLIDGPGGLIIGLNGNANPTLPKEAAYDGWLAYRVAQVLAPGVIPVDEVSCSAEEAREAIAA